jgi:hypothetical protein
MNNRKKIDEIKCYLKMLGVDFTHREDGMFVFWYLQYIMEVHENDLHVSPILHREAWEGLINEGIF